MTSFPRTTRSATRPLLAGSLGLAVAATGLSVFAAAPAQAAVTDLVISEVYGGGGGGTGRYLKDFVELYNPTTAPVDLTGSSLQYRSAANTDPTSASGVAALSGTITPGQYFVVELGAAGSVGAPVPNAGLAGPTTVTLSGTAGQVFLAQGTTAIDADGAGNATVTDPAVIDFVGYGSAVIKEGAAAAPSPTSTSVSLSRGAAIADTDDNGADFTIIDPPTPGAAYAVGAPPEEFAGSIAELQGTTGTSPHVGDLATTRGVVTAAYPTGGFNGFYLQTPGTGGATDATPGVSDAIFVFGSNATAAVAVGQHVQVQALVAEFAGSTQLTPSSAAAITQLPAAPAPRPLVAAYPTTDAGREAHESELVAPTDSFTVTNTFNLNNFAEIGLATGTRPLIQPTDVARVGTPALDAVKADNAARAVALDDGASLNYLTGTSRDLALPWLSPTNPIRVGAPASLRAPVILDYRNNTWKLQPTRRVTGAGSDVATFVNTRTAAPEKLTGALQLATFNVLNYFNTTAVDWAAAAPGRSCTYFTDRGGNRVGANDCAPRGPRGAAEADDLKRQQDKIVAAINSLGAEIVSLEEIENSVALGEANRDDALAALVAALNTRAGKTRWAFAPSPPASELPPVDSQDVIRTAFIYDPVRVRPVGVCDVLESSPAFANARQPLAQAFKRRGASDKRAFAVVVNHFKSKGDSEPPATGDNANGEQGAFNGDRVRQARALGDFAREFAKSRKTRKIFLTGDFNAYTQEDPMRVLYSSGFLNIASSTPGETTYSFSGLSGSLDHVLANKAALAMVTGSDIWNINSPESVAFEYSRYNYNLTDFYQANAFRASDHDPEIVGIRTGKLPSFIQLTRTPKAVRTGARVRLVVRVRAGGEKASGYVKVRVPGRSAVRRKLTGGRVVLRLPAFRRAGAKQLTVTYNGSREVKRVTRTLTVRVQAQ